MCKLSDYVKLMAHNQNGSVELTIQIFQCICYNAQRNRVNVMDIECTGRRIGDMETLAREVAAWTKSRNNQRKKINWKFTRDKADKKLSKYYVP